jgi:hypothetical protein
MNLKFKLITLLCGLLCLSSVANAKESLLEAVFTPFRQKEIVPVSNQQYQEECGSCHFAYPPGLLPARSWQKLLTKEALSKHFGQNAELDPVSLKVIYDYALANAADQSYHKRSRKIAQSTAQGEPPLRITAVRYIQRKHQHLPAKMVKDNPAVKSLSYCDACHTQASQGVFDKDFVKIPNYADWQQ